MVISWKHSVHCCVYLQTLSQKGKRPLRNICNSLHPSLTLFSRSSYKYNSRKKKLQQKKYSSPQKMQKNPSNAFIWELCCQVLAYVNIWKISFWIFCVSVLCPRDRRFGCICKYGINYHLYFCFNVIFFHSLMDRTSNRKLQI